MLNAKISQPKWPHRSKNSSVRSASLPRISPPRRADGWNCWRSSTTAEAGPSGASDRARTGSRGDVRFGLRAAREHVRVAHQLKELPLVREAFSRGELSYCKVRALTRAATPATEAALLEIARHATGAQLEKLMRCYAGALSATLGAAQRALERRYLRWNWEDDGSLRLEARLPADDGAVVLNALRAAEEQRPERHDVRGADAGVARRCAPRGCAGGAGAIGASRERSPVALEPGCELVVHVDVDTLAADEVRRALPRSRTGPTLAPRNSSGGSVATRAWCGSSSGMGGLTVGRRRGRSRRRCGARLRSRDAGCRFPGCTHARFIHAHHIKARAKGGPTTLENLVQLCSYHHRLVHEGRFPGGVVRAWLRCGSGGLDGRVVAPAPECRPGAGPGPGRAASCAGSCRGREARAGRCRRAIGSTMGWRWRC